MQVIGHRGARGLAPENTIQALQKGLDCHVDALEIDVRVTSDGVPVVFHDALVRHGNQLLRISQNTFSQLQAVRPTLITLDEAISFVKRRVPMLVEVKGGVPTRAIIDVLKDFLAKGWQPGDFRLISFSQPVLLELHAALPTLETGVLERFFGLRAVRRARALHTTHIIMSHHNMWWGFIASMHRKGWRLSTFTLNNPARARRWARYGLYAVITDFPDRFTINPQKP